MTVRIWRSFSCNNSSSHRLIGRFEDAAVAREVAEELVAFFAVHAREVDVAAADVIPAAAEAFAEKYGFAWGDLIFWGDTRLEGNEPSVLASGGVVVAYHSYCSGFDAGFASYLRARGALTVDNEQAGPPDVTLLFASVAGRDAELDDGITDLLTQPPVGHFEKLRPPWPYEWPTATAVVGFRDAATVGLHLALDPDELAAATRWLAAHGITDPIVQLCEPADAQRFAAIGRAHCTACAGGLDYLDPRLHDIETAQLVCRGCGGLYDLSTFTKAQASR